MADLQRATTHPCGARCCGDLDGQGSHPHQRDAAGAAARFLQVPAAEHQAPRRFCAAPLVSSLYEQCLGSILCFHFYFFI